MLAEESGMEKRSSSFAEKNVDLEGMRGVPPTSGLTRAVASCSLGSIRQRREVSSLFVCFWKSDSLLSVGFMT